MRSFQQRTGTKQRTLHRRGRDKTKRTKEKEADSWGVNLVGNQYVGPNLLGRLLMELRDTGKLDYTLPADALTFLQHLK